MRRRTYDLKVTAEDIGNVTYFKIRNPWGVENEVRHDKRTERWSCTCWWYANRTAPNKERWGECSHIIRAKAEQNLQKTS